MTRIQIQVTLTPEQIADITQQITDTVVERSGLHDTITDTIMKSGKTNALEAIKLADEVLALFASQPTVAEVKAQALEEAAETLDELQTPDNDHPSRRDPAAWLIARAHQIREEKKER